jgi:hypothetical protein
MTQPYHVNTVQFGRLRSTIRLYSSEHTTCYLSSLTLYTAAVGTTWSLLDSPRNGQAVLHLIQKHLLFSEYIHSLSLWAVLNGQKTLGGVFRQLPSCPFHSRANN